MSLPAAILGLGLAVATAGMQLSGDDFSAGAMIGRTSMATDCGGRNRTPALHWSGAPSGAQSFALIERDPDAPVPGGFFHWVIYNLPATTLALKANATLSHSQIGVASTGQAAYYGPCPPAGPAHHYIFTLYALDVASIKADAPLTAVQLEQRISGHVLAKATITALAKH